MKTSTKNGKDEEQRHPEQKKILVISVIVLIDNDMVLVAISVCIITALVQIAALRNKIEKNAVTSDNELMMLRQNISQLNSDVQELRAHNTEELMVIKHNFMQFQLDIQQIRYVLRCPLIISFCSNLDPNCPSDYYWVRASNGSLVHVYCNMTLSCGNITGGWMIVAELNTMTSQQCPQGLIKQTDESIHMQSCALLVSIGCSSTLYSTHNIDYTNVCGRITAYQVGTTNAFRRYYENIGTTTINSTYVDGVSLTHGSQREHTWTFVAALDKQDGNLNSKCPCLFNKTLTEFVGDDYFCDSGSMNVPGNDDFLTDVPSVGWD